MKNKTWIIIVIILVIAGITGIWFYQKNNSKNQSISKSQYAKQNGTNNSTYETNKSSANLANSSSSINSTANNNTNNNETTSNSNTLNNAEKSDKSPNEQTKGITENDPQFNQQPSIKETQIAIFSTKIYTKDSARQNNISITSSALNDTIVKNGQTFSFCQTIGPATTQKGYQEADIFDNNGQKKKGLGGGNCQISTTLYNAVLAVPTMKVTERHAHSNNVPYIQKGKDAAVAYGSYDLKFQNNTGNDLKIRCEANLQNITVSLISLQPQ